ncbi:MAG TPA: DNA polymerase I, partial [Verrucomicrobiales bacterium]|nr:DNA polymerase I [Verrucomicrobiales bacterium]
MSKRLFLLDGMALVYRAHFAFISRPIVTSAGVNTSALFGFTNTLLDILKTQQPTHLAVAFDTPEPTARHVEFPAYKAQREEMPEDLAEAIPNVKRLCAAMNIPVLELPGYEADDIVGTLVRQAEAEDFESYMVTPDKDFAQLVAERTFIFKPGKQGSDVEILKLPDVRAKWGVERAEQVIDILGLWGDASDNIPGVPGIGEKTAAKLIAQFGSIEELLANTDQLKGKQKEKVEEHREQALLSKRLATINCAVPLSFKWQDLAVSEPDAPALRELFIEFEFNSLGRRMFGEDFKAGRGFETASAAAGAAQKPASEGGDPLAAENADSDESSTDETDSDSPQPVPAPNLKTIADVPHEYQLVRTAAERRKLLAQLKKLPAFCFDTETTGLDPKTAVVIGIAFSWAPHQGVYVQLTDRRVAEDDLFGKDESVAMREEVLKVLAEFRDVLAAPEVTKIGHNLKFDLSVLHWHGIDVAGPLFDTMLAHSLVEPEQRHGMDFLSEVYLGYTPVSIKALIGDKKGAQENMANVPIQQLAEYAAEDADVTWQLHGKLVPLLVERGQERVFYDLEMPLLPVLVAMEAEGVRIDAAALSEFSAQLEKQMATLEARVHQLAGDGFNLNSPKQLGEVLFDKLKLLEKPKKTRTGQYSTDEQTLQSLAADHEIVRALLEYRTVSKLKSTYADALPQAISPKTGRVHTTYHQAATATGRLASNNPNLQNIPIRTEEGRKVRAAFVSRAKDWVLLSADYSQI